MTAVVTRVDSYSCRGHVTTCPLPDLVPLQRESSGRLARSGGEIRSRSLGQLAAAPGRACLVKVSTNFAVIFTIFGHGTYQHLLLFESAYECLHTSESIN